jgi:hypothetical protein
MTWILLLIVVWTTGDLTSSTRVSSASGDVHALMKHSDEGVTACGGLDLSLWRRRVYR